MTLQRSDWTRTGRAGPSLSYVVRRVESPKAIIGIVPGYADHAARYEPIMDVWADLGIASVGIDLRGHGRSDGTRGHVAAFDEYIDDFRELGEMMGRVARDAGNPESPRLGLFR